MIRDSLVHVLVMAAEDRELGTSGVANGVGLLEAPSTRGKQDDRWRGAVCFACLEEGIGPHHHSRTPAVRVVVYGAMPIMRIVTQIDDPILHASRRRGASGDGKRERRGEEVRKDREDANEEHGARS